MNDTSTPAKATGVDTAPSPTETAATRLETLSADSEWQANFSGNNGRKAQTDAAEQKSALLRPPAAEASHIPQHLKAALDNPETSARAEGYVPAAAPTDYAFKWTDAESVEHGQEMTAIAQEAAFAVGANKEFAEGTVKHIQERVSHVEEGASVGANPGRLDETMTRMYGDEGNAMIAAATEVVLKMPEAGRAWTQNTLNALDADTAAWVVQRLSTIHRANKRL